MIHKTKFIGLTPLQITCKYIYSKGLDYAAHKLIVMHTWYVHGRKYSHWYEHEHEHEHKHEHGHKYGYKHSHSHEYSHQRLDSTGYNGLPVGVWVSHITAPSWINSSCIWSKQSYWFICNAPCKIITPGELILFKSVIPMLQKYAIRKDWSVSWTILEDRSPHRALVGNEFSTSSQTIWLFSLWQRWRKGKAP